MAAVHSLSLADRRTDCHGMKKSSTGAKNFPKINIVLVLLEEDLHFFRFILTF